MRKALLTSSEVSALVSICVVILFTMALFLSGYTIQQRTLQDLRVAIKPGHSKPSPKAHLPDYFRRETRQLEDGTVMVKESQADKDERDRLAKKYELGPSSTTETEMKPAKNYQKQQLLRQQSTEKHAATPEQLRLLDIINARAAGHAWGVDHPDPLAKNPLPITRAERRKLIKEEIQRLAQAERPVYYQRRLW